MIGCDQAADELGLAVRQVFSNIDVDQTSFSPARVLHQLNKLVNLEYLLAGFPFEA